MRKVIAKPLAYSYVRFSTKEQAKGDSLRRQKELAAAYCKRKGWTLDAELTIKDLGVSAFRGDNAFNGNLRVFLDAIASGTVTPGSVLIVESIDRLSRQGIDEGYDLIKRILKAGILLVTLSPEREFDISATKSLTKGSLEILLILERAAEESERKSERVKSAWAQKRKAAREGTLQPRLTNGRREKTKLLTRHLPAWITERDGEAVLKPGAKPILQRVFELAAAGYGHQRIVAKMLKDEVPPLGSSGKWTTSFVNVLLSDRRVLGEHQPRDRKGIADGPAIEKYYPPAVDEDLWRAARLAIEGRNRLKGRVSAERINLFAGLLRDARSGESYFCTVRNDEGGRRHVLLNYASTQKRAPACTFPAEIFERAVLTELAELDPSSLDPTAASGTDEDDTLQRLSQEKTALENHRAELQAALRTVGRPVQAVVETLAEVEDRLRGLNVDLERVRALAAHPLQESLGEVRTLVGYLEKATDLEAARLRLREALRRILTGIYLLVVPRGHYRLCKIQAWFTGRQDRNLGVCRTYLLVYRPPRSNGKYRREGCWGVISSEEEAHDVVVDYRDPTAVQKEEARLAALSAEEIEELLEWAEECNTLHVLDR